MACLFALVGGERRTGLFGAPFLLIPRRVLRRLHTPPETAPGSIPWVRLKEVKNMAHTEMKPWTKPRREIARRGDWNLDPFAYLQGQMNRIFEDTLAPSRGGDSLGRALAFAPVVEITDAESEVRLTAELPGIEAKEIDLYVSHDTLTIRGEKRQERRVEEKGGQWTERAYGAFERTIPLPTEVKEEQVKAHFQNGVLEVVLPKREGAKARFHKVKVD